MKNKIFSLIIFINFSFSSFASEPSTLSENIEKVLKENYSITQRLNIAIAVNDLDTDENVYSLNPYNSLVPASVTKLFTAYAALDYLKPAFTYQTQILFDKDKVNSSGTLSDNLYLKFTGDPSLTKNDLRQLFYNLKNYNVKKISGNIIIDDSMFDQNYQAPGWPWDDSKFCYAAPTSAIVIDKNCFQMNLSPQKTINNLALLTENSSNFAKVINKITTQNNINCSPELFSYPDNSYELTGCINQNTQAIPLNIAYQNPQLMIIQLVKDILKQQNITFKGKILFNTSPLENPTIITHKSKTLDLLVKEMLKNSNNIIADNLIKTIGAYYYNTQGTFTNGTKALGELLDNIDIDSRQMRMMDGSGGSRYNLISPDQLVKLNKLAFYNTNISSYFYNSLLIPGVDESLKYLDELKLSGKIHAKTGSMSGVFNLSGYLEKDSGRTLVFAIMINGIISRRDANNLTKAILIELSN